MRTGEGRDIVFLHGWGMHGGVWREVASNLAPHYCVHAVDLPGMGDSPPCQPNTLAKIMAELVVVLPARAVVCGWSWGGQLALQLASAYPERVARLVLVGATPRFVNGENWDYGASITAFQEFAAQVNDDYAAATGHFLSLQALGSASSRELIRALRQHFTHKPAPDREALQAALQILLNTDLRQLLPYITQPALVVHGERDTLAPLAAGRWLARHLPQARLAVIKGASHAPFLSHPEAFMAALQTFLEQ